MADIHIVREHTLGLEQARKLARRWAEVAHKKLEMECAIEEGPDSGIVRFRRSGASGELRVDPQRFTLDARLGLLLGMFRGKIESEIVRNLDELLAHEDPMGAFEQGLAKHEARRAARTAKAHADSHKAAAKSPAKAATRKSR